MPEPRPRRTGSERLVTFTDAVAAIGLTLLALPLVDLIPAAGDGEQRLPLDRLLAEHSPQFGAFLLSFVVIFRFWWAHHRVFAHVSRISRSVISLSALWCLGIVFLPVPTAIITAYSPSAGTVLLYEGTLVLISGSLLLIGLTVRRNPDLSIDREPLPDRAIGGSASTVAVLIVALVLGVLLPDTVNYWALVLLLVSGVIEGVVVRLVARSRRRELRPED